MKLKDAIKKLGSDQAIRQAEQLAQAMPIINWSSDVSFVFYVIAKDWNRIPGNIGGTKDDEIQTIQKWLNQYKQGYQNRASKRISQLPRTIPDPIIEQIIGTRLKHLKKEDLRKITFAHRLAMSAENILGFILEEYLAVNLLNHGWHCAWGETVKSVDFIHENGRLLQIKNRSNSENSSSTSVRDGTKIEKWYRIKANKIEYMWDELNKICGTSHLSDDRGRAGLVLDRHGLAGRTAPEV